MRVADDCDLASTVVVELKNTKTLDSDVFERFNDVGSLSKSKWGITFNIHFRGPSLK